MGAVENGWTETQGMKPDGGTPVIALLELTNLGVDGKYEIVTAYWHGAKGEWRIISRAGERTAERPIRFWRSTNLPKGISIWDPRKG